MPDHDERATGEGSLAVLRQRLKRLRREQGEPSLRYISVRTGHAVSHSTVAAVLACERLPRWGQVDLVVEALNGDTAQFRRLWVAARDQQDPPGNEPLRDEPRDQDADWLDLPTSFPELETARTNVDEQIRRKRRYEADVARELFEAREERADRDDEIARLRARAAVDEAQRQHFEGEISRLLATRDRLTARIRELETTLGVAQDDLVRLTQEKAELAERYAELRWDWARHEETLREKLHREVQELRNAPGRDSYEFIFLDAQDLPSALRQALTSLSQIGRSIAHDALADLHTQLCITLTGTDNPAALASLSHLRGAVETSSQLASELDSTISHLTTYVANVGYS